MLQRNSQIRAQDIWHGDRAKSSASVGAKRELASENEAATRTCDVLYVEDDPVNFTLAERILEIPKSDGLGIVHAPQGQLGLEFARRYLARLILLDPQSARHARLGSAERLLQEQESTEKIPVVVLSANATPSAIERLLQAGAKNYLIKPFDIDHFLAVVDEFVTTF